MPENNHIFRRIGRVYWLVVFFSAIIMGRIIYLQFDTDLRIEAQKISVKQEDLPALRGNILANDGRVLAISLPYYELFIDCTVAPDSVFNKHIGALSAAMAKFFKDKTAEQYKMELTKARKEEKRYKRLHPRLVSYTELQAVKNFPLLKLGRNKGGLIVEQKSRRKNPYDRLAYRTIGWKNAGGVGVGIEDAFDSYLRGTPGKRMVQRLPGGEWMPLSSDVDMSPRDGMNVVTTLDVDIQDAAETALRAQLRETPVFEAGTAIVMEVATGEIRAIANMKRHANGSYDESFNYAIGWATEPGSTFKLATLIALLEDSHMSLSTPVEVGNGQWRYYNKLFNDAHAGSGVISLQEVLEQSSNVGFAKSAVQHYAKGKEKQFVDRLYNMNLNKQIGLQIKGEASPTIGYPGDKTWSGLSIPMMAMGYEVLLTPMHTLTLYNAVANNGKMVKPKFVKAIQDKRGVTQKEFSTEIISSSICSPAVLAEVHKALRGTVEKGTAKKINDSRYHISGKTGTSRLVFDGVYEKNGFKKHQASFVGFFPSEAPKYSAIVVLYSEKTRDNFYGATWAAPAFKQIADKLYVADNDWNSTAQAETKAMPLVKGGKKTEVEEVLDKLNIPLQPQPEEVQWVGVLSKDGHVQEVTKKITANEIPSVVNMGLKDALFLLENMDLEVRFSGDKGRVLRQSPEAGTKLVKGQQIFLELGT
ncbi:MAG: PASTA domain-containing protein [Prevotellaceae bacterium]|jgi:cell division protein FtsI (penicillin-binding protein 3)|nr:PASTA domain-containing protein [Prevotellaceae bacterium]